MEDLAPCPFCGSDQNRHKKGYNEIIFVVCDHCGAVTSFSTPQGQPPFERAEVIKIYNDRHALPSGVKGG